MGEERKAGGDVGVLERGPSVPWRRRCTGVVGATRWREECAVEVADVWIALCRWQEVVRPSSRVVC